MYSTSPLPFSPSTGDLYVQIPVNFSKQPVQPQWAAYFHADSLADPQTLTLYLCTPASAPVGTYQLQLHVLSTYQHKTYRVGQFTLLCNPWCKGELRNTDIFIKRFFVTGFGQ